MSYMMLTHIKSFHKQSVLFYGPPPCGMKELLVTTSYLLSKFYDHLTKSRNFDIAHYYLVL